jgi:hypothetical protein
VLAAGCREGVLAAGCREGVLLAAGCREVDHIVSAFLTGMEVVELREGERYFLQLGW